MKKKIALLLSLSISLALVACNLAPSNTSNTSTEKEDVKMEEEVQEGEEQDGSFWDNTDTITIKFAHGYNGGELAVEMVEGWMELVTEESEGKIQWDYYPGGSMGSITELIEQTDLGVLDCTVTDTSQLENFCDEYAILFYPFLIQSYEHQQAVLGSSVMNSFSEALSDVSNLHVVGYYVNGARNMCTKTKVSNLEDCKGLIIRVPEIQVYKDFASLLGMSPTVISYSEVYTAMNTGVCEGMECPNNSIYPGGFHDVGKYILKSGHMYSSCAIEFNTDSWNSYPTEVQDLLVESFESLTSGHADKVIAADEEYYRLYEEEEAIVSEWDDPNEPVAACEDYWNTSAEKLGPNAVEIVKEIIALRN